MKIQKESLLIQTLIIYQLPHNTYLHGNYNTLLDIFSSQKNLNNTYLFRMFKRSKRKALIIQNNNTPISTMYAYTIYTILYFLRHFLVLENLDNKLF